MTNDIKKFAQTYFDSWKNKDFDTLRSILAPDASFRGPLGQANGIDECVAGVKGLSNITVDINILHMWSDDKDVITWFEFHTTQTSEPLSVVNWSHIENGKIKTIKVTFDPRSLFK